MSIINRVQVIRIGSIFENSNIGLHKWLYAMYLFVTSRKGIPSLQLSKEIGITQKSAWFLLQRIRASCKQSIQLIDGIVEIEETYIGGREKSRHEAKKRELYIFCHKDIKNPLNHLDLSKNYMYFTI